MTRGEGEPVTTWSCQRYSVLVMDAYSCDGCRQVGAGWMHYARGYAKPADREG